MEINFRFTVGDEVTLRAMCSPFWLENKNNEVKREFGEKYEKSVTPQKMVVVGRIAEQCYADIQINYKVRIVSIIERGWRTSQMEAGVLRDVFVFTEFELMPWSEYLDRTRVQS